MKSDDDLKFYECFESDSIIEDSNNDFINNNHFDKTHIRMSHFTLCESFGRSVLGLNGYSLLAYRLMSSFAINNFERSNGLYCCFSYIYLANSLNCGLSTAKRIIKSLCDKQIIKKIGFARNGRCRYEVLKTYEFDSFGALMVQYDTLDKKRNKRINLKNIENQNNKNIYGLPLWVSYYGNFEKFISDNAVDINELIKIAKTNLYN